MLSPGFGGGCKTPVPNKGPLLTGAVLHAVAIAIEAPSNDKALGHARRDAEFVRLSNTPEIRHRSSLEAWLHAHPDG